MHTPADATALVLVEGVSDKVALETLARRRGRDLDGEGISVVAIGGAQALGNVLRSIRAEKQEMRLAGLCDVREERVVRRALDRAGLGSNLTRETMEGLGFYVCEPDLEGELIRALGATAVEEVLAQNGKLSSFRTFQKQPQWQGRPTEDQLRRFFGSSAGKIRFARLLAEALDLDRAPRPLDGVLAHVGRQTPQRSSRAGGGEAAACSRNTLRQTKDPQLPKAQVQRTGSIRRIEP